MCFMAHQPCLAFNSRRRYGVFTLTQKLKQFLLTSENIQVAADTKEYAINSSNNATGENPVKRYIEELLAGKTGPREKDFNMRWDLACMVGDIHRILCRSGIFMYPYDLKDPKKQVACV